ncbi:MAG TPA: CPBP family intramembrane glutamic endopeptidase [Rudaea sp.]|nr:CPBP family intramembrane glutamic endopeptidase [Rudaea sp.]
MNTIASAAPSVFRRVVDFPLSRLLLETAFVGVPVILLREIAFSVAGRSAAACVLAGLAVVVASCLWYVAYARWIARRDADELPLRTGLRELGAGFGIGGGLCIVVALLLLAAGGIAISATGDGAGMVIGFAFALAAGVVEEILLRGIVFRNLEALCGSWFALAFSAALFGALHLANPHASVAGALSIALQAGILLGAAYMATRSLWWPIGIHIGWNFAEGGVLGVRVSGTDVPGWFHSVAQGPVWLSGGEFGIEASSVATLVCLAAALAFLRRAWISGRFVTPLWRRNAR